MRRPTIADLIDDRDRLDAVYRIFVRDLEVDWLGTGLLASIDLLVDRPARIDADRYRNVVCYDTVVKGARALAATPEIGTLRALAEGIAGLCLEDARVRTVAVRLAPRTGRSGIEVLRRRPGRRRDAPKLRLVGRS